MRAGRGVRTLVAATAVGILVLAVTNVPADAQRRAHHDAGGRMLRHGSAASVGLVPSWVDRIHDDVASYLQPSPTHPLYAGASVLAAHRGTVVADDAVGYALRYAKGDGTELPRDQWVPARTDTIYDLASVSKLFTSLIAVQQIERGRIDVD